jgi:hypothetical protein
MKNQEMDSNIDQSMLQLIDLRDEKIMLNYSTLCWVLAKH